MSRKTREIIEQSWSLLAARGPDEGTPIRDLADYQTPHGTVLLSLNSRGVRGVLVPVGPGEVIASDTDSAGIQLVEASFDDGGTRRRFVDIRCPEPRLHRIFSLVAASMLDALVESDEPAAATCARVLASWRELLRRATKPLSRSVLRGVYGELYFLAQLVEHGESAVDYWTGPDDAPQDFISSHGAFEVKTSSRTPARRISISSVDQLDDASHDFLTLVVISLVEDPEGESLAELLDRVVDKGAARERLLDKLVNVGVLESDLTETSELRFRVAAQSCYAIDAEFPRVVPSSFATDLPAGVHNLRYEVELRSSMNELSTAQLASQQRLFING